MPCAWSVAVPAAEAVRRKRLGQRPLLHVLGVVTSHDEGMLKCISKPCIGGAQCGDAGPVLRL